jgi:hypothetical protein
MKRTLPFQVALLCKERDKCFTNTSNFFCNGELKLYQLVTNFHMRTDHICTLWKVGFVVNIAWVLHTHQISTRTVVLSAEGIPKHILKSGSNVLGIVFNTEFQEYLALWSVS